MKVALFCHSLASDWNHGNAHFLRGVCSELQRRGHEVCVFEPNDGWSARNLVLEHGRKALEGFRSAYPSLWSQRYAPADLDLDAALDGVDLAIVHEWNAPELVARVGRHFKSKRRGILLFHDTHHRAATAPEELARYDLRDYDGVLAFGAVIRDEYLNRGWARRVFVWHEAADTHVFWPRTSSGHPGDLVWVGNWGDDERTREMREYLVEPVTSLGLSARVYGVRYPLHARRELRRAGIDYAGFLPNYIVPDVFSRARVTPHIPRRPYATALPGIPTIRVFEALACGIPLICSPWDDAEHLFNPGQDYLVARNGQEMQRLIRDVLNDPALAASLATQGLRTIRSRHTCEHRVDELLAIYQSLSTAAVRTFEAESRV